MDGIKNGPKAIAGNCTRSVVKQLNSKIETVDKAQKDTEEEENASSKEQTVWSKTWSSV